VAKTVLSCYSVIFKHLAFDKLAGKRVVTVICIDQKSGITYIQSCTPHQKLFIMCICVSNHTQHTLCDIYYNKPTRCSCSQSILFHCRVTLHVSCAFNTHHQEYIKLYLQPPVQVILWLQLPSSNVAKFRHV